MTTSGRPHAHRCATAHHAARFTPELALQRPRDRSSRHSCCVSSTHRLSASCTDPHSVSYQATSGSLALGSPARAPA